MVVGRWPALGGLCLRSGQRAHGFGPTDALGQLDDGARSAEVHQLLGHADLSTTSISLRRAAAGLHESARAAPIIRLLAGR